jgi:segregation and condensation protein A
MQRGRIRKGLFPILIQAKAPGHAVLAVLSVPFTLRDYMSQEYKVRLEVFEGPLDLLLYLIKRDEIDIYGHPIERITKQYLEFMSFFKMLDLEVAGEFVEMAAKLIYIKSRSLLPVSAQPPEEEAEEEDPRWELVRQLLEYKKFKEAAQHLGVSRGGAGGNLSARSRKSRTTANERPLGDVSVFDLINAFNKILKRLEDKPENLAEIFEENFSVADKIDLILKLMSGGTALRFTELFSSAPRGAKSSSRFSPSSS